MSLPDPQFLADLLQASPQALALLDEQGRALYANPAMAKRFAHSLEELSQGGVKKLVSPTHHLALEKALALCCSGKPNSIKLPLLHPNNQTLILECSLTPYQGKALFLPHSLEPLKERLVAAQKLAGLVNWSWDLKKGRFELSQEGESLFGQQLLRKLRNLPDLFQLVAPQHRPQTQSVLEQILVKKEPFRQDLELNLPSGPRRLLLQGEVLQNSQGDAIQAVGIIQDITKQKQTEEALIRAKEIAEQADHAKSAFLANMSHEIRTPIHGILGLAKLIKGLSENPKQLRYLEILEKSSLHLLRLVNEVLDYSKIAAGEMRAESEVFALQPLLQEIAGMQEKSILEKGLQWELLLHPDLPPGVIGDPAKLNQILLNLVSNAVKFTSQGYVRLQVRPTPKGICFEVADSGVGISDEQKSRLFQPFSQGDPSYSRRFGGTGLGLMISKKLVELLQGELSFHSTPGQGSRFSVTLPLQAAPLPLPQPSPMPPAISLPPKDFSLLLVEDDPVNQLIALDLLGKQGFRVDLATTGVEALKALEEKKYDLIFMDIQMPVMDGIEATRRFRAFKRGPNLGVPIIALTAHALAEDRKNCLAAGMDDYLAKPIDLEQIQKTFARLLPGYSPPLQTAPYQGLPPQLVATLRRSIPQKLQTALEAIKTNDATRLSKVAHDLKSNFAGLGQEALAQGFRELETRAKEEKAQDLAELFLELKPAAEEFLKGLEAARAR